MRGTGDTDDAAGYPAPSNRNSLSTSAGLVMW